VPVGTKITFEVTLEDKGGSLLCRDIFDSSIVFDCSFDALSNQIVVNDYFEKVNNGIVSIQVKSTKIEIGDKLGVQVTNPVNFYQSSKLTSIAATAIYE
jgi:hypothetical protein